MAILGNLIKNLIKLGDQIVEMEDPLKAQDECLKQLLDKAKHTDFGRHYSFDEILKSGDMKKAYAESVPYFDYDRMMEEWWGDWLQGKSDVSWPGKPEYFALSSGTTGKESKRIPVSKEMLDGIRRAGRLQILSLNEFDLPDDFFEKEILMLSSSTELKKNSNYLEGEISGISASIIPFWFRSYYKPGEEIAAIDDWDQRVAQIAQNAPNWDIGALSGIPSWIELMLDEIIDYHNLENIHEIWPHLEVFTSGGVAFEPYQQSFRKRLGRPIHIIDTYLASEGFLASQLRADARGMQLFTDNGIYFEFVPFRTENIDTKGNVKAAARAIPLSEVEEGEEYVLILSSNSGAWRYMLGDTVEILNREKAEIKITGRTKFFLNKVGSQLSVHKLDQAVEAVGEEFDLAIREYTVSAQRNEGGDFYHYWYLGTEDKMNEEKIANFLDEHLKRVNNNYKVARSKALRGVKVKLIPSSCFHDWNDRQKKKGGQVKMEKVMGDEQFEEWTTFLKQELNG